MYSLCEIFMFINLLKYYENNLVLIIFDFLFADKEDNNCIYDLQKMFLYCFGILLKDNKYKELHNILFNTIFNNSNLIKLNKSSLSYNTIKNKYNLYNLKFYLEICSDYYLHNYNVYCIEQNQFIDIYNDIIINLYKNSDKNIKTINNKIKIIKTQIKKEISNYNKLLKLEENRVKNKLLRIIF
jgi:hypothetical protein